MTAVIPASSSSAVFRAGPYRSDDGGDAMATPDSSEERAPLGQRLLDRPFLLLLAGLVVMFGFYTLWGLYEILSLPAATLP
jgi:hypothetical protein